MVEIIIKRWQQVEGKRAYAEDASGYGAVFKTPGSPWLSRDMTSRDRQARATSSRPLQIIDADDASRLSRGHGDVHFAAFASRKQLCSTLSHHAHLSTSLLEGPSPAAARWPSGSLLGRRISDWR